MKTTLYVFLLCILLYIQCTPDIAGGPGSGSETTNSITVAAVYSDGTPVKGAVVRLHPSSFLFDPKLVNNDSTMNFTTITDDSGKAFIQDISKGDYSIEINDARGYATLIMHTIDSDTSDSILPSKALKKTITISGTIDSIEKIRSVLVQVYGIERIADIDSTTGAFTINDLPEGLYALRVSSPDSSLTTEISGIIVADTVPPSPIAINISWPFSQSILFNTTESGAGISQNVTNFPVILRLHSNNFDFSRVSSVKPSIGFTNSYGDPLPFQIEEWDSVNQSASIWVKVDTIHKNDFTTIIMNYGNNNLPAIVNSGAVFDTAGGFEAVWHMSAQGNMGISDASTNSFTGTFRNTSVSEVHGIIGKGLQFSDSAYIEIPASASGRLNFAQDDTFAISAWVYTDTLDSGYHSIINKGNYQYGLQINRLNNYDLVTYKDQTGWSSTNATAYTKSWHYITGMCTGDKQYLYIDGSLTSSAVGGTPSDVARDTTSLVMIGRRADASCWYFNGIIDEIRISSKAHSAAWIKLCYENQRPGQKFVNINKSK